MEAVKLLERADKLRREGRFGEAINAYRAAAASEGCPEDVKKISLASVELMQEINGFVNVDLMNP